MRSWIVASLLGVTALVGASFLPSWRRPVHAARMANDDVRREFERLERRIRELEAKPESERVIMVQQTVPNAAALEPATEPSPAQPADEADIIAAKATEATLELEARFSDESPDPAHERDALYQARAGIETGMGSRVSSLECVASMCKVVVTHDSLEEQTRLGNSVQEIPLFREGTYLSYERDTRPPRTTLYALRPGHSFRQ